jgi:hypothetical protein
LKTVREIIRNIANKKSQCSDGIKKNTENCTQNKREITANEQKQNITKNEY